MKKGWRTRYVNALAVVCCFVAGWVLLLWGGPIVLCLILIALGFLNLWIVVSPRRSQ